MAAAAAAAFKAVRFVASAASFLVGVVFLCIVAPVTLLHGPLLKAGVPHKRLPGVLLVRFVCFLTLYAGGVRVRVDRQRSDPESLRLLDSGPCILMYTHSSNLDPLIVNVAAPCGAKFIYKKELARFPFFGWALFLYGHVAIDRRNRDKAIDALHKAVRGLTRRGQSIAIAPEGTRSRTGELLEFKRGPFHLAQQSGAPAVPLVIRGAYELLPPKSKMFSAGTVDVIALPPVAGGSVDEVQAKVRAAVEAEVGRAEKIEADTKEQRRRRRTAYNGAVASVVPSLITLAGFAAAAVALSAVW